VNDPFLGPGCYPREEARTNADLFLITPETGGHVGFIGLGLNGMYWSEWMTMRFLLNPLDADVQECVAY
jgi:uncharacterized protein